MESIIQELVGGLMAIVCAVIGARLATKSDEKRDHQKTLRDAYADVFAGYFACMLDNNEKNGLLLVTAMQRLMMICSEESEKIMGDALVILASDTVDMDALGNCLSRLRESAKKDVEQYQRKKRRSKMK